MLMKRRIMASNRSRNIHVPRRVVPGASRAMHQRRGTEKPEGDKQPEQKN